MEDAEPPALQVATRCRGAGTSKSQIGSRAEYNRQSQQAYRQRQKARVAGLEDQVAELSQRVVDLEMELTSRSSPSTQGDAGSRGHPGSSTLSWKGTSNDANSEHEEISDQAAAFIAAANVVLQGISAPAADLKFVTIDTVVSMCMETFKQYVDLLEAGADVPGSSQEQRLCGIIMHMQAAMFELWKTTPVFTHKVMALYLKTRGATSPAHPDLPKRVLASLHLSDAQKSEVVGRYRLLMATLGTIYADYQTLLGALSSSASTSNRAPPTLIFQACDEVSAQLDATAMAKMRAMQDFAIHFYTEILHPVQNARGHVTAFPHIMDTMAVARLLVAEKAKSEEVTESDAGAGEGGITEEMLYWLGNGMVASDSSELPESSFRLSEDSSQFLDPDGSVLVLQPADRMHIMEATLPGDSNFVDC